MDGLGTVTSDFGARPVDGIVEEWEDLFDDGLTGPTEAGGGRGTYAADSVHSCTWVGCSLDQSLNHLTAGASTIDLEAAVAAQLPFPHVRPEASPMHAPWHRPGSR